MVCYTPCEIGFVEKYNTVYLYVDFFCQQLSAMYSEQFGSIRDSTCALRCAGCGLEKVFPYVILTLINVISRSYRSALWYHLFVWETREI